MSRTRLKSFRADKGLTQRQLAERLGVHFTEVAHYERGRRVPSLAVAVRIERLTASWPLGPIRPWEWVDAPRSDAA